MGKGPMDTCSARAPCSTANLGPGYDVFGLAMDALEDRVTIRRSAEPGISIIVSGQYTVPAIVEANSAGVVVRHMATEFDISNGISVYVEKGIPAGYGMGSSGASAAAAALAFQTLFALDIDSNRLVQYAAEGELASAGARHYDNVSASLLGGFVITRASGRERPEFIRLDTPSDLYLVAALPDVIPPKRKTEKARSVLPREVPLASVVHNVSAASAVVAGFATGNVELIASGVDDIIVEPARHGLIRGYDEVKARAIQAGALAVTISGAGPSLISLLKTEKNAGAVAQAMKTGFKQAGLDSRTFVCRPAQGARIT